MLPCHIAEDGSSGSGWDFFEKTSMLNIEECEFKKCCKKYETKNKHCKKCPKK
jgi:hypothetical protein